MSTKMPPDGGWGWVVIMACAINSLTTIPIMQSFGLIFKDSFVALNLTATDTTIIINVNLSFGMILGLMNGPLLKNFGYRKIALIGSILHTFGITLTTFANNFSLLICSYGILSSIGIGMSMSAFSLAVNSYFVKKRNRAVGMMVTISGLGPILMPQLTSFLLSFYGIQGTILLFGAYSLHSIIGSLLLQPIKWHMKNIPNCPSDDPLKIVNNNPEISAINTKEIVETSNNTEEKTNIHSSILTINNYQRTRKTTTSSIDHDVDVVSIYGFDTLPSRKTSTGSVYNVTDAEMMKEINEKYASHLHKKRQHLRRQNLAKSVDSINLGSSLKIFEEPTTNKKLTFNDDNDASIMEQNLLLNKEADKDSKENCNNDECERKSVFYRILRQISNLYDFDLLRDPIYVNIMLGMSIAIFAEANFSLLTPFILADMNMETDKIAYVMSLIAIVDLISRCAAPFLGEWLHQPSRIMYLLSLCFLIIGRALLIFTSNFTSVLIIAIGLGFAKGIRSVYMVLVVPNYVPIHKLPNASGIQMLTNGMILLCAGPLFGVIRDYTGSYNVCIVLINCMTALTILIWTIEMIIIRNRKKSAQQNPTLPSQTVI